MASTAVSRYRGESEEYEGEEDDDDDDEEDENEINSVSQNTKIGKANLSKCKKAHLGNESVYHGEVKVRNLLKISIPDVHSSSSIVSSPSTARIGDNGGAVLARPIQFTSPTIHGGQHHFPAVVIEDRRQSSENDELERANQPDESTSFDEATPLTAPRNSCGSNKFKRRNIFYLCVAIFGVILLVMILIYEMILYYNKNPADEDNLPMNFTERLIVRGEWFALEPSHDLAPFTIQPIPFVIVGHTAGSECDDLQSCRVLVRNIQSGQMLEHFYDIMYNYLVGGDGYIYEGRGWNDASAGIRRMNCSSLFVGFIGNFLINRPPIKQLNAFKLILEEGVRIGKLVENFKMFMQKQIVSTESPGEALIEILRKWPHWRPFNKQDFLCDNRTIN